MYPQHTPDPRTQRLILMLRRIGCIVVQSRLKNGEFAPAVIVKKAAR